MVLMRSTFVLSSVRSGVGLVRPGIFCTQFEHLLFVSWWMRGVAWMRYGWVQLTEKPKKHRDAGSLRILMWNSELSPFVPLVTKAWLHV